MACRLAIMYPKKVWRKACIFETWWNESIETHLKNFDTCLCKAKTTDGCATPVDVIQSIVVSGEAEPNRKKKKVVKQKKKKLVEQLSGFQVAAMDGFFEKGKEKEEKKPEKAKKQRMAVPLGENCRDAYMDEEQEILDPTQLLVEIGDLCDEFCAEKTGKLWLENLFKLYESESLVSEMKKLQLPIFFPEFFEPESNNNYLILAQSCWTNEQPLNHKGLTGEVARLLAKSFDDKACEISSDDLFMMGEEGRNFTCACCKAHLFPPGHWFDYLDPVVLWMNNRKKLGQQNSRSKQNKNSRNSQNDNVLPRDFCRAKACVALFGLLRLKLVTVCFPNVKLVSFGELAQQAIEIFKIDSRNHHSFPHPGLNSHDPAMFWNRFLAAYLKLFPGADEK